MWSELFLDDADNLLAELDQIIARACSSTATPSPRATPPACAPCSPRAAAPRSSAERRGGGARLMSEGASGREERAGGAVGAVEHTVRGDPRRGLARHTTSSVGRGAARRGRACACDAAVPAMLTTRCLLVTDDARWRPSTAARVRESLAECGLCRACTPRCPRASGPRTLDAYRVLAAGARAPCAGRPGRAPWSPWAAASSATLAGFAAATYMRGCHLVQVATSLLAMVDSTRGRQDRGRPAAGQEPRGRVPPARPRAVRPRLRCGTLPADLCWRTVWARSSKYAVMADPELFALAASGPLPARSLERVVARCIAHQARRASQADEREAGVRKLLNLGHTVGHAIELLSGYAVAARPRRGRGDGDHVARLRRARPGAPPRTCPGASRPCCARTGCPPARERRRPPSSLEAARERQEAHGRCHRRRGACAASARAR